MKKHHEARNGKELFWRVLGAVFFGNGFALIVFHTIIVVLGLFTYTLLSDIRLFAIGIALISAALGCKAIEIGEKSDRRAKLFLDKVDKLETNILARMETIEGELGEIKGRKVS